MSGGLLQLHAQAVSDMWVKIAQTQSWAVMNPMQGWQHCVRDRTKEQKSVIRVHQVMSPTMQKEIICRALCSECSRLIRAERQHLLKISHFAKPLLRRAVSHMTHARLSRAKTSHTRSAVLGSCYQGKVTLCEQQDVFPNLEFPGHFILRHFSSPILFCQQ